MVRMLKSRLAGVNKLFLWVVVLPTVLSAVYFGLIASDVYISESRFVVRSPERQTASTLGLMLKGAGFSRAQDDTYTVQDYMLSRDALRALNESMAFGKAFSREGVDIFSRFPGLDGDDSFEALFKYYVNKVGIAHDAASSISTLTVRAFDANDAVQANRKLLEQAESLVNQLNERGRQDLIRFAAAEVGAAELKSKTAALALSSYRDQKGVVDPEGQATLQLQQIGRLQDELIATRAQLAQLKAFTPENPQIAALQVREKTLRAEVDAETRKVMGGERSLANKAAEFQRLVLEREFADRQLASAMASLEQARNEALRKQLYLERIVQPNLPDVAMEPRRLRSVVVTVLLALAAWGILSMLVAGVREHKD